MFGLGLFAENVEGPNAELLWLVWILLGLFALTIIVGWWAGSRKSEQASAELESEVIPSEKKSPDDLIRIEGIGPKVAKVLKRSSIETFDELAHAKADDVQMILDEAGLQMMNPEGWIEQAKLAAKGDWAGFEKLQKELKGGRKAK